METEKECTCIIEEDYAIMGAFAGCPIHSRTNLEDLQSWKLKKK